jgi:hypothetical protein
LSLPHTCLPQSQSSIPGSSEWVREGITVPQGLVLSTRVVKPFVQHDSVFAAAVRLLDVPFLVVRVHPVVPIHLLERSRHQAREDLRDAVRD